MTTGSTTVAVGSRWIYKDNRPEFVSSIWYVTGSHALKTGISQLSGYQVLSNPHNANISSLRFVGGVPNQVATNGQITSGTTLTPIWESTRRIWCIFRRLTLNFGARFDHFNVSIPEQAAPVGNFVSARSFAPISNQPNFNDWWWCESAPPTTCLETGGRR